MSLLCCDMCIIGVNTGESLDKIALSADAVCSDCRSPYHITVYVCGAGHSYRSAIIGGYLWVFMESEM